MTTLPLIAIGFPVHSVTYGPIMLGLYIKGVAGLKKVQSSRQVDFLAEQVTRGGREILVPEKSYKAPIILVPYVFLY